MVRRGSPQLELIQGAEKYHLINLLKNTDF